MPGHQVLDQLRQGADGRGGGGGNDGRGNYWTPGNDLRNMGTSQRHGALSSTWKGKVGGGREGRKSPGFKSFFLLFFYLPVEGIPLNTTGDDALEF